MADRLRVATLVEQIGRRLRVAGQAVEAELGAGGDGGRDGGLVPRDDPVVTTRREGLAQLLGRGRGLGEQGQQGDAQGIRFVRHAATLPG